MPLWLFEIFCVVVIALTATVMARGRRRRFAFQYGALALAAWLGEDSCIALYEHYEYAPGWHVRLHHVPLLIPLIWPLVILSAREIVDHLWPDSRFRSLLVGTVVLVDASLIEVIAVRAELWSWAEGGHLGVPLIGMLGWAFFAACSDALRERHPVAVFLAVPFTHLLLLASWWGGLRWVLRDDFGAMSIAVVAALGLAVALVVARRRRSGFAMPLATSVPRMIASSLFFALLIATAPKSVALWLHTAAVALPYLVATRFASEKVDVGRQARA